MSRGPLPWGCGSGNDQSGDGCEGRRVCGDARDPVCAYLGPSELCNLRAGQVIRLLKESGADSWALLLAPQEELKTSKIRRVRRKRLAGQSSLDRDWHIIDEIHRWESSDDPSLEPISSKVRSSFCQLGRNLGVHVITTHPYSVRHGGRRRMRFGEPDRWWKFRNEAGGAAGKSVGRYEKHARLLKETAKLSKATQKYGQLVMSRVPQLLEGAQPPPPPVLTKLVRSRA